MLNYELRKNKTIQILMKMIFMCTVYTLCIYYTSKQYIVYIVYRIMHINYKKKLNNSI